MNSPSPVPRPGSLVEKNGSKICFRSAARDPLPAVAHLDDHLAALGVGARRDLDAAPGARGVHRVGQEVQDHLLELARVPVTGGTSGAASTRRTRPAADMPGRTSSMVSRSRWATSTARAGPPSGGSRRGAG